MTKTTSLARLALGAALGALLAACSAGNSGLGGGSPLPNGHESGLTPLSAQRLAALTMPHYQSGPVHTDRSKSWMTPDKKKSSALIYIGDWGTNDVYVFSGYPKNLKLAGTLTGFDEPYGMCVDQKGDVFVSNFGNGELIEYAHGGSTPLNTYTSSGYGIGCSISAKGDVSITDFYTSTGAGTVCIWKGGTGSSTCYSDSSACYYMWTFGYDHVGDLVGLGEYSSIVPCELPEGSSTMVTLSFADNAKVDFPGGTQWDGKYIAMTDQESGGQYQTGIQRFTLSGTTLTPFGSPIILDDNCYGNYVDDVNPFYFGNKNVTAASTKSATRVAGPNLWCYDQGKPAVDFWKYPAGGNPVLRLTTGLSEPYGVAVSMAK